MSTAVLATTRQAQSTPQTRQAQSTPPSRARGVDDTRQVRACAGDERGPQPSAEPPVLQLSRRGRALLTVVSVLVFGAAVAVLGLRVAGVLDGQPEVAGATQVQLGAGQTLWSVARETSPAADPAQVVEEIARLNNLHSAADLRPGQLLLVPVFR